MSLWIAFRLYMSTDCRKQDILNVSVEGYQGNQWPDLCWKVGGILAT
jgi:hypothetical protein